MKFKVGDYVKIGSVGSINVKGKFGTVVGVCDRHSCTDNFRLIEVDVDNNHPSILYRRFGIWEDNLELAFPPEPDWVL